MKAIDRFGVFIGLVVIVILFYWAILYPQTFSDEHEFVVGIIILIGGCASIAVSVGNQ
mgnify:CR=1 FL=1